MENILKADNVKIALTLLLCPLLEDSVPGWSLCAQCEQGVTKLPFGASKLVLVYFRLPSFPQTVFFFLFLVFVVGEFTSKGSSRTCKSW